MERFGNVCWTCLNVVRKLSKSDTEFCLAAFTHFTFVFEGLIADRAFAFTGFLSFDGKRGKWE